MKYNRLNPLVRSAKLYERVNRTDECVGYDSRIFYIISGDLTASVGGERLGHLCPGNLLYIPAGTPYKLKSNYVRMMVITFDLTAEHPDPEEVMPPVEKESFDESRLHPADVEPFDRTIFIKDAEGMRDEFISLGKISSLGEGDYLDELSARVKLILLRMAKENDKDALPSQMVMALDEYIRENCREEISNTEIGAIFGYHPFYVSNLLKEKKGITLRQYIISYRLRLARSLLELTAKSTQDIAEECGFTDSSYFAKSFKAAFGETPKEYRNRFKEEFI
ncbi:MAG: helix-turn-helix domain-containing protein [Clostridia bacterium]|nr:helix-turn-helix domain-containing protein [Clostridia bacterium]